MARIETGIDGLDELIDGGLPNSAAAVVKGGPGTGKTIFCTQYLWHGLENGDRCLFITTEELPEDIKRDADTFGWELDGYAADDEDELGQFHMEHINPSTRSQYVRKDVENLLNEHDSDRVVIDSLSVIGQYWHENSEVRGNLTELLREIKEHDATALVTAEAPDNDDDGSRYGMAEFVADGVIALDAKPMGSGLQRTLTVKKMRASRIDGSIKDLEFTDDGLVVE